MGRSPAAPTRQALVRARRALARRALIPVRRALVRARRALIPVRRALIPVRRRAATPEVPDGATGPELARAVLDAALAQRRQAARAPRRRTGEGDDGTGRRRLRGYSGPGPDPRDPQPFSVVLDRLMKARGWQKPAAEATVFGAWERVVGPDVAAHSRPVKLENGELTVEAESTAWATQLRMLAASLLKRIAAELGHNVVTKLHIHGPAAPSWNKGPRRVRGRGPRDTYG